MDTRSATFAPSLPQHQTARRSPRAPHTGAPLTPTTGYARGSQTAGLSQDMLGAVNASRIAALKGVAHPSADDRTFKGEQVVLQAYRQSQVAINPSTIVTPRGSRT